MTLRISTQIKFAGFTTAALVFAALLSGCSTTHMALRELDQDIPRELLPQYQASQKAEIDKGRTCVLPLFSSKTQLSKSGSGFHASRQVEILLGLLGKTKEDTRYSESGTLLDYTCEEEVLIGLIQSQTSSSTKQTNGYRHTQRWGTLWGLIHSQNEWVSSTATVSSNTPPSAP